MVALRGRARDNLQISQTGELGQNFILDTDCEKVIFRVRTEIFEGKNRDRSIQFRSGGGALVNEERDYGNSECERKPCGSDNETFSPPARSRLKTEVAPVNLCK